MHLFAAALTVFASFSTAKVPFSSRTASSPGRSSEGLPIESLLPLLPSNELLNLTGGVQVPVGPFLDFETRFTLEPAQGMPAHSTFFEGGELTSSILYEILKAWRDPAITPITHDIDDRDGPFSIWHTIHPAVSQTSGLSTRDVGIVYCLMLNRVLAVTTWPGHIKADIWTGAPHRQHMGSIDVHDSLANTPVSANHTTRYGVTSTAHGRVTTITTSHSTQLLTTLLQTRAERERIWLIGFARLMFFVVNNPPSQHVLDAVPPFDERFEYYPIRFQSMPSESEISISRYAGNLTWDTVGSAMIELVIEAATFDIWDFSERATIKDVNDHDIVILSMKNLRPSAN